MNRCVAQTAAATSTTMPSSHRPPRGTVTSDMIVTGSRGRIGSTRRPALSGKRLLISEMNTMTKPILATSLARARNTSKYTAEPTAAAVIGASSSAHR